MNRTELIDAVATRAGLERRQAEAAVKAFAEAVMSETRAGVPVSVFGFGTFKPTTRAARTGRNPQTGDPVKIASAKGVKFQPATAFKASLNTRGAAKKASAAKTGIAKTGTAKTGTGAATATKSGSRAASPAKSTAARNAKRSPSAASASVAKTASVKATPGRAPLTKQSSDRSSTPKRTEGGSSGSKAAASKATPAKPATRAAATRAAATRAAGSSAAAKKR